MAKRTTVHCDQCGKQVDYYADREYNFGFRLVDSAQFEFRNHSPSNSGYASEPIAKLVAPENLCSKECVRAYFNAWIDELPAIVVTRDSLKDREGDK